MHPRLKGCWQYDQAVTLTIAQWVAFSEGHFPTPGLHSADDERIRIWLAHPCVQLGLLVRTPLRKDEPVSAGELAMIGNTGRHHLLHSFQALHEFASALGLWIPALLPRADFDSFLCGNPIFGRLCSDTSDSAWQRRAVFQFSNALAWSLHSYRPRPEFVATFRKAGFTPLTDFLQYRNRQLVARQALEHGLGVLFGWFNTETIGGMRENMLALQRGLIDAGLFQSPRELAQQAMDALVRDLRWEEYESPGFDAIFEAFSVLAAAGADIAPEDIRKQARLPHTSDWFQVVTVLKTVRAMDSAFDGASTLTQIPLDAQTPRRPQRAL